MCELYNTAKNLAASRGLNLTEKCPVELDCDGINCSVANLGQNGGGDGLVEHYEGVANTEKFYQRVEKTVVIMQAAKKA